MRKAQLPTGAEPVEEIIEVTINKQGVIRVIVVPGHNVNGDFIPLPQAQAQQYTVMWEDFDEVITSIQADEPEKGRPSGAIFFDDFWPYIDRCRKQQDAVSKRELATRLK